MLESVGELDAETAAEARSAVAEQDHARPSRERSQPATPASPDPAAAPQRRRHSSVPDRRRPSWDSPSRPSAAPPATPPRRSAERRFGEGPGSAERGEGTDHVTGHRGGEAPVGRAAAADERPSRAGDRARGPGAGWVAHMAAVHAAAERHAAQADSASSAWEPRPAEPKLGQGRSRPIPASTPAAASGGASAPTASHEPAGVRGRMFKEALWKRKVNMQTMTRLRTGRPPASSEPLTTPDAAAPSMSPRSIRERARGIYAAGVRSSFNSDSHAASGGGRNGVCSPRGAAAAGARGSFDVSSPRGARQRQACTGTRDADRRPSDEAAGRHRDQGGERGVSSAIPPMKASAVGAEAPQRTPPPPPEPASSSSAAKAPASAGSAARDPGKAGGPFLFRQSATTKDTKPKKQSPQPKPPPASAPPPRAAAPPPATSSPQQPQQGTTTAPPKSSQASAAGGAKTSSASRSRSSADASTGGTTSSSVPKTKPPSAPPPRAAAPSGEKLSPMQLLELRSGFTDEELRAAYKRAAMRWHPDRPAWRAAGEEELRHATEMFQKCKEAYDILSGKPSRAR